MSFFDSIFGAVKPTYHDPMEAAAPYLNQIQPTMEQYYNPYVQMGLNPGQSVNQIGQGFQQSPGLDFALQKALGAGNNAAAAGGMAGSPQHQYQNMQTATGLANQDYYNWLNQAQGQQRLGFEGTNQLAQSIMDSLMAKAGLQTSSTNQRNMRNQGAFSDSLGLGATGLGYAIGGPMGAMAMGSTLR